MKSVVIKFPKSEEKILQKIVEKYNSFNYRFSDVHTISFNNTIRLYVNEVDTGVFLGEGFLSGLSEFSQRRVRTEAIKQLKYLASNAKSLCCGAKSSLKYLDEI